MTFLKEIFIKQSSDNSIILNDYFLSNFHDSRVYVTGYARLSYVAYAKRGSYLECYVRKRILVSRF